MKRIFTLLFILIIFIAFNSTLKAGDFMTPESNPVVGSWYRIYSVDGEDGTNHLQMEIYVFDLRENYRVYYFSEGSKHPFSKESGVYLIENPLIILRERRDAFVINREEIWKNCNFTGDVMSCEGYHAETIPFRRWHGRPDELKEPLKNGFVAKK